MSDPEDTHNANQQVLIVAEGPAYGDERSYNALRVAGSLGKREGVNVRLFLIGDAVTCAVAGQKVPDGYYHLDRMIQAAGHHGVEIGCCGTCLDARGITDDALVEPARRSTLDELTDWIVAADKTLTF